MTNNRTRNRPPVEDAIREARQNGTPLVRIEDRQVLTVRSDDGGVSFLFDTTRTGATVYAAEGTVYLVNLEVEEDGVRLPVHDYDYRVRIDFDRERRREVITELAVLRRPDGPDITTRGLQGDRLGEVQQVALMHMLTGGTGSMPRADVQALLEDERPRRRRGAPTKLTPSLLAEVAEVCAAARSRGEAQSKAIYRAFDNCGSVSTARNWHSAAKNQFPERF